jgi:hypothetical protein
VIERLLPHLKEPAKEGVASWTPRQVVDSGGNSGIARSVGAAGSGTGFGFRSEVGPVSSVGAVGSDAGCRLGREVGPVGGVEAETGDRDSIKSMSNGTFIGSVTLFQIWR